MGSCALIFGTPITREEFFAAAEGAYISDYATLTLRGRQAKEVWSERYSRICAAAADLIEAANAAGCSIYSHATLHDLSVASRTHDTLIVFAHWKGERVSRRDLLCDHNTLREVLLSSMTPAAAILRERIQSCLPAGASHSAEAELAERISNEIVRGLNDVIVDGTLAFLLPNWVQMATGSALLLTQALARDLVDEALSGVLAPGNRLELFDGLHAPGDLEGAVVPGFRGTIDLGICHSVILAFYLKHFRGDNLLVIQNDNLLDPLSRYSIIAHTLSVLRTEGGSYEQIRFEIERALINAFAHKRF